MIKNLNFEKFDKGNFIYEINGSNIQKNTNVLEKN